MDIDEAYKGREHSFIKHELLRGYLEALLSIVAVAGRREFTYIDCFAGPWGGKGNDLSATSIAISLDILEQTRETLAKRNGIISLRLRAIYVEKAKSRYNRLNSYLGTHPRNGIECHALHGDYWTLQDQILTLCGQPSFCFFFIDPKGWTDVGVPRLRRLIQRPYSEFMITFMYDFLNRAVGIADQEQQVAEILGPLTEEDRHDLGVVSPKDREAMIVRRYRERLKAAMQADGRNAPRTCHAIIMDRDKERTKYHLVYLTRHPKGIVKFAEQSEKAEFVQRVVRRQIRQNESRHLQLFTPEDEVLLEGETRAEIQDVREFWLQKLGIEPRYFGEAELADMLEESDWLIGDLEAGFAGLQQEGKVANLDAGSHPRPKHPIKFSENKGRGERLRRCV